MLKTLRAYKNFDPAATSLLEIGLCYPGVRALIFYRVAHFLYGRGFVVLARFISDFARFLTGIEIHPAAEVGNSVIIEHGTGVVVGSTAVVEDNVVILQGVTLGSKNPDTYIAGRRHPHIKKGALLCAGAKILGPVTVGESSVVGANAVVITDIPSYCTAVGAPARALRRNRAVPQLRMQA